MGRPILITASSEGRGRVTNVINQTRVHNLPKWDGLRMMTSSLQNRLQNRPDESSGDVDCEGVSFIIIILLWIVRVCWGVKYPGIYSD